MILKIRTSNINSHLEELGAKESWRYFDGVEGLHYSRYASEEKLRVEASRWANPSDVQEIWLCEQKPADDEILFMAFSSDATGPMHIFCNTVCYLLNDNGRNIERLI